MTTPTWTAGASSASPLVGDGWFSFRVPTGSAGVFVGVSSSDTSTHPSEPTIGFMFRSGRYHIERRGTRLTASLSYPAGQLFSIVRHGSTIHLCAGAAVAYPGVPFSLPGKILHSLQVGPSVGALLLDASLLTSYDAVNDAEMVDAEVIASVDPETIAEIVAGGTGGTNEAVITILADAATPINASSVQFRPMTLAAAAAGGYGAAAVAFEPMGVRASARAGASASINMLPLNAWGIDSDRNGAGLRLEPMTLTATKDPAVNGAEMSFSYPAVTGRSNGTSESHTQLRFMEVSSGNSVSFAEASAYAGPMYARAYGGQHILPGIYMTVRLPRMSGEFGALYTVIDEGFASEAITGGSTAAATDGAFVSSEFLSSATSLGAVEDVGVAEDAFLQGGVLDVEGFAWASETLSLDGTAAVEDVALASDLALPQTVSTRDVLDGARASELVSASSFFDVTSTAEASDSIYAGGEEIVVDVASASDDVLLTGVPVTANLVDGALADDEMSVTVNSQALLQSTAVADEVILMKQPGLVAWVMNTDTGAVSWYDNWAFTSMAVVGDKVFAAGPDGLHVLGGERDGDELIDARVQFGFTEFGGYDRSGAPKPNEQKKRAHALWFGYHADGELSAKVETYGQGYGPFAYAMAPRAADQPRNNRIVPGKGLNARYWRIDIENTNGCAFEVHSLAAEMAANTRRL